MESWKRESLQAKKDWKVEVNKKSQRLALIKRLKDDNRQSVKIIADLKLNYNKLHYFVIHPLFKHLHKILPKDILLLCAEFCSYTICLTCNFWHPKIFTHCKNFKCHDFISDMTSTSINNQINISFTDPRDQEVWDYILYEFYTKKGWKVNSNLSTWNYNTKWISQSTCKMNKNVRIVVCPEYVEFFRGIYSGYNAYLYFEKIKKRKHG